MSSHGAVHILSVCDDDGLRSSRELVLKIANYVVQSHPSNAFLQVSQVRLFDLAIVCQSINDNDAARLIERLRRYHPNLRVLRLGESSAPAAFEFGPITPDALLKAVRDLIGNRELANR
jgi:DNA-binding NarL/FixJ family response regulator